MQNLEWSALEYEERDRTGDWFWALGTVIITGTIASMIYSNFFFAALLVISGALLAFFAQRSPEMMHYQLGEKGLRIRNQVYLYENMKSFWVQEENAEFEHKPMLFVKTDRVFMPVISVHTDSAINPDIKKIFLEKNVPEEEMQEHLSEKIMDYLGF